MQFIRLSSLAVLIAGALSPAVNAQNVVFTNSSNNGSPYTIPLAPATQQVVIAPNGDIKVSCQLDGTRCVGFPTGGSGGNPNAPVVSMSHNGGASPNAGASFTVTVSSTNSAESCVRSSSPTASNWDGVVSAASASANVSLNAPATTYTLTTKCFNDAGAGSQSLTITTAAGGNNGGGGVPPQCPPGGDVAGFSGFALDFKGLWGTNLISPERVDLKVPGGAWRAFRFVLGDFHAKDPGSRYYQAQGVTGFGAPPYANMMLAVSECPGQFSNLAPECVFGLGEGSSGVINFDAPRPGMCTVDPSKTYYMNVMVAPSGNGGIPSQCVNAQCSIRIGMQ